MRIKKSIIFICLTLCIFCVACGKKKIVIPNINLPSYMEQLNGVWVNQDSANSTSMNKIEFAIEENNSYAIKVTDGSGVVVKESLEDINPKNDEMKSYGIMVDGKEKYSFYMSDCNNIVLNGMKFRKVDEYFDARFNEIEGAWINDEGVRVTFFVNGTNRYINMIDGFGAFNKLIYCISFKADADANEIMTREGSSLVNFTYKLNEDGSLSFSDYVLYRNEDQSEYELLQEEDIELEVEESAGYDLSVHGSTTGYEVPNYGGDIDTDMGFIFIGDSRFVGMNDVCGIGVKSNQFVVAKVGMGYYWLIGEAMEQVESIMANHTVAGWTLVFNMGINDMGNINNYKNFYAGLADKPYNVAIVSVNPVGNYPTITNDQVASFNDSLKQTGYRYIDTYSYLMNDRGYVTPDGLHYGNSTYQDIYRYIIYELNGWALSSDDLKKIDNQYLGEEKDDSISDNTVSDNSVSDNSVSDNTAEDGSVSDNGVDGVTLQQYYEKPDNSVAFSTRIQAVKDAKSGSFSSISAFLDGNTISFKFVLNGESGDEDWDSLQSDFNTEAATAIAEIHSETGISSGITLNYIYYDAAGNEVKKMSKEG